MHHIHYKIGVSPNKIMSGNVYFLMMTSQTMMTFRHMPFIPVIQTQVIKPTHFCTTKPRQKSWEKVPQLRELSKDATGVANRTFGEFNVFVHWFCAGLRREKKLW